MSMIDRIQTALVIAPHPDDEVLGCGGTIARLTAQGKAVDVAVVTRGFPPAYSDDQVAEVRAEARAAHARLGVRATHYLDLPAAGLDAMPQAEINRAVTEVIRKVSPDTLFVPHLGDIHIDHQLVFAAAMVASRPAGGFRPDRILAYETLSETNWNAAFLTPPFTPNLFIDIEHSLDAKLEAFTMFASQCRPFPNERSIEALRAMAMLRGAAVHAHAAEAFIMVREIG